MITNAQNINYKYLSLWLCCCLGACLVHLYARAGPARRQPACSVRVALCTCCALCAIKHMTQKHWCVRAAREREEGVKTHRYAVLKGCRERDIVRPPAPVQITPELPTAAVFYFRITRNLVGSREKQCGDCGYDLNTAVGISLPRWSGYAVIVTALATGILEFKEQGRLFHLLTCWLTLPNSIHFQKLQHYNTRNAWTEQLLSKPCKHAL